MRESHPVHLRSSRGTRAWAEGRFSSRIFLHAHSKHTTATEMAQLFVDEICYKAGRGIPLSVISDNDKLFTAQFFKSMFERFGTKWLFSTARSQSTDGKAERYIAVVEEILRTRINYKQTDWEVLLSAIMFINNQQKCSLLNQTPIEIEMNITPIVPADLILRVTLEKAVKQNTAATDANQAARLRIQQLTDDRVKISEHIKIVQADQKKHYDARHSTVNKLLLPGAKAYLDIPYQQMVQHGLRPSNKLSHTVFGPFPIVKQHTANSFELDLGTSASKRVINVFHVKYLRHAPENDPYQQPNSQQVLPVSGSGDDEEWELEKILDKRTRRLKTEYLVRSYLSSSSLHGALPLPGARTQLCGSLELPCRGIRYIACVHVCVPCAKRVVRRWTACGR